MKTLHLLLLMFLASSYAFSQPYEIRFDVQTASGWFGGDNRPGQRRNVAVAQSVFVDNPVHLQSFAFHFASRFDSAANSTGAGHQVTLRLHIRDSAGAVLRTEQVVVPSTFNGGWVTWPNINLNLSGPARFIFSTYLLGGYDSNQVTSSQSCDVSAGYSGGERYSKYVVNDSDAVSWNDWSPHLWDSNFWLTGTLNPTGVDQNYNHPKQFRLEQNYPNPFNPTTIIKYQVLHAAHVSLKVFDLLGREVANLVDEVQESGLRSVTFDAGNSASGVYLYRLRAGNLTDTKKLVVLR